MIRILLSTKLGEMKWSQADLARATGIRPNTISELYHEYWFKYGLIVLKDKKVRQRICFDEKSP